MWFLASHQTTVPGTTGTLCLSPSSIICCPVLPPVSFLLPLLQNMWGFPDGSDGEESACNAGDAGSVPGWGRSPGEGNGNPLQYSCLETPHGQKSLVGYSPRGWIRVRLTWATNTIISLHMRLMTLGASLASAISPVFSHLFKSQKIWSTEAIRKAGQFL